MDFNFARKVAVKTGKKCLHTRLDRIGFVGFCLVFLYCIHQTTATKENEYDLDSPSTLDPYLTAETSSLASSDCEFIKETGNQRRYQGQPANRHDGLDTQTLLRLGQVMATIMRSNEKNIRGHQEGAPSNIRITDALHKYESFLSQIERDNRKKDPERAPGLSWSAAFILTIPPSVLAILLARYLAGNNRNGIVAQLQRHQEQRLKARWKHPDDTFDDPYERGYDDDEIDDRYRSYDDSDDYHNRWAFSRRVPRYTRNRYDRYRPESRYMDYYGEEQDEYHERSDPAYYQRSSRNSSMRSYA